MIVSNNESKDVLNQLLEALKQNSSTAINTPMTLFDERVKLKMPIIGLAFLTFYCVRVFEYSMANHVIMSKMLEHQIKQRVGYPIVSQEFVDNINKALDTHRLDNDLHAQIFSLPLMMDNTVKDVILGDMDNFFKNLTPDLMMEMYHQTDPIIIEIDGKDIVLVDFSKAYLKNNEICLPIDCNHNSDIGFYMQTFLRLMGDKIHTSSKNDLDNFIVKVKLEMIDMFDILNQAIIASCVFAINKGILPSLDGNNEYVQAIQTVAETIKTTLKDWDVDKLKQDFSCFEVANVEIYTDGNVH